MAKFLASNNAKSTLASGVTASATTIYLSAGDGALFPSPGAGEQFPVTMTDSSGNIEIAYATARATDQLTVVRGQEGTAGLPFAAGDAIELRYTKGFIENMPQNDGNLQTNLNAQIWDGANKTVSTSAPSGGADGDLWFKRAT